MACEYDNCSSNSTKSVTVANSVDGTSITRFMCDKHAEHVKRIHESDGNTVVGLRNIPRG